MGSPITFSGFNNIDFGLILDAVMQQEQAPLRTLQAQQKTLESRAATYRTLAAKLSTFESAVEALAGTGSATGRTATNTNPTIVSASASDSAATGLYDVVVDELARAQVTASTSFPPDPDQTTVAMGGALVIGGVPISVDTPVTLQGLADLINANADVPVTATVVRAAPSAWQLVLTGKSTGGAGAFTIQNTLSGGAGVTFADSNGDGVSGDSADDNAVSATDARVRINNVAVQSASNTIENAIQGVTLTLLKKDPSTTATVAITEDLGAATSRVQKLVDAYNDLVKFAEDQNLAASRGESSSIARDPLLRGLRGSLREHLSAEYAAGGALGSLAVAGLGFDRTGRLVFDAARFEKAATDHPADLRNLFNADGADKGVFRLLAGVIDTYTAADGLLSGMNERISDQVSAIARRSADLEERLAVRRAALQKEYIAADMAMSQLNSQMGSLSSLGGQYRLF
jgi:flagellar hook-associated protein 2